MATVQARAIIATNSIFMVASGACVILRFYARKRNSSKILADDWLVVAAWGFAAALAITNIIGVPLGRFGLAFDPVDNDETTAFLKVLFALQFFYIFAVAFVKLSVLYFYKRIFTIDKRPLVIWMFIALTIGWLISFFFATLFQIYPIWCNWIVCEPTTNFPLMYVMSSATDVLLDISILCLPAFFIRNMRVDLKKKMGIAGIFGLGIFCVVASIARLVYTIHYMQTYRFIDLVTAIGNEIDNVILWSGIEACVSTACACLPCYGNLLRRRRPLGSFRVGSHDISNGLGGSSDAFAYLKNQQSWDTSNASKERNSSLELG